MPDKTKRKKSADTAAGAETRIIKFIPAVIVAVIIALCVYFFVIKGVPYEEMLSFTPDNYFLFTLLVLFCFGVKSLSVVFHIAVIYVFVGNSYPLPAALAVNTLGIAIVVTIPYLVGKISGSPLIERLQRKYPKLSAADKYFSESQFFSSFLIRVIGILPGDIVSMLFGAKSTKFTPYFFGSLLGYIPTMIATTCVGATITDPTSPAFLISVSISVFLSVLSIIIQRIVTHRVTEKKRLKKEASQDSSPQ